MTKVLHHHAVKINRFIKVLIYSSTVSLSACVSTYQVSSIDQQNLDSFYQHQHKIERIDRFEIKGKVGIKTGNKGGSATLKWKYDKDFQTIELYGPLGGGRMVIKINENSTILTDAKGNKESGKDAESLLKSQIGWSIPFSELLYWIRGLPTTTNANFLVDDQGLLASISNKAWQVKYQQYQQVSENKLPRKLTLTSTPGTINFYDKNNQFLADQINIKVIISNWNIK